MAAAAEALIERVEPNWAIENVPSHASRASADRPGPSWPKSRHTSRGRSSVSIGSRAREVVDAEQGHALRVQVGGQSGDVRVVVDVLVAVGDHRSPAVPPPVADDVHLLGQEGVGGPDDRADVEVVLPVLDRDVEVVPAGVQVGDDRLQRPVAVAVHHVAPVALGEQPGVVLVPGRPAPPPTGPTPTSSGPCGIGSYGARRSGSRSGSGACTQHRVVPTARGAAAQRPLSF